MNLSFVHCGKFTSRDAWTHPEFTLSDYELIIVTEGRFILEEEGISYRLEPNGVLLIEPGKLHRGIGISRERISFYWIHFHSSEPPAFKSFRLTEPYPSILLCRQLLHYSSGNFTAEVKNSLLRVLLAEIDSKYVGQKPDGTLASRISEWIRINSDRQIDVSDLTERFGYNEDYMTRLIRARYGIGLKQLIVDKRMAFIKGLLLKSELSLTEVAARSGFADGKLFLKFFKYHEGITPTEFRGAFCEGHTNNR